MLWMRTAAVVATIGLVAGARGQDALAWKDLVGQPQKWPLQVKLTEDISLTSGKKLAKGSQGWVTGVEADVAEVTMEDGMRVGLGAESCNLVAAANAYWGTLNADQRALTLTGALADESVRPEKVAVLFPMEDGGTKYPSGTEYQVVRVEGDRVLVAKDFMYTSVEAAQTDVLYRARRWAGIKKEERPREKYWAGLSDEQKALTLDRVAAEPSIMPMEVTVIVPMEGGGEKYPAGTTYEVAGVKDGHLEVAKGQLYMAVDVGESDVLRKARGLLGMPRASRPARVPLMLAGTTIDADGKPAEVKKAEYYVFYFASSTCPRCAVYTPTFVERWSKTLKDKDVSVVIVSNDGAAADAEGYAKKSGMPWPIVPWDLRRRIMNTYHVTLMPGMVAVDKWGAIVATNSPGYPELATVDAVLDQLDGRLAKGG